MGITGGSRCYGIYTMYKKLRPEVVKSVFVEDAGDIPSDLPLRMTVTCREAHPMVCKTHDADMYNDICGLAKSLERECSADKLHKVLCFYDEDQQDEFYVLFASAKARRPRSPITKVFGMLEKDGMELKFVPDRPVEVDGCERTEPHFVWMTSWCLAKTLLSLLEGGTVRCEVVRLEPCSGAIRCENSWACGHEGR